MFKSGLQTRSSPNLFINPSAQCEDHVKMDSLLIDGAKYIN